MISSLFRLINAAQDGGRSIAVSWPMRKIKILLG